MKGTKPMSSLPLSVVVADDHSLFRQGLISLINARPDLARVIAEAETGREVLTLARQCHPNVILMDICMPEGDGLQATARIRQEFPEIAIVILTASEEDEHVYEALRLGAAGYLLKSLDAMELFNLLCAIAQGETVMTRAMANRLLKQVDDRDTASETHNLLSEREIEVLHLLARGASNPEIADTLAITVNTVKVHVRNIMAKLNVDNRTQAATIAVQTGLLPPIGSQ